MIDTKELEMKIYACIILDNSLLEKIELDERYFKTKAIMIKLKELYARYKYLDVYLITNNGINKNALEFVKEVMQTECSPHAVFGYYKQLKEMFRDNTITEITNAYKQRKIDYKEFSTKMFYLNKIDDFDEDEILTVNNIKKLKNVEREYTNIEELDYLLKGIEYGKLSLWSGITNHGKTTIMTQFAKECVKNAKKIFYFSGEQNAEEFKNYLYIGMCKKEQLEFITDEHNSKIYDVKPKDDVIDMFDDMYKDYIYIYNNNIPTNDINTMIKVMQKAFNQGIRIFFIDNFMQLDNSEKLEEQTKIVESFKRFARNNNCIINLVAHPRKTQYQKSRLSIFDISGTQNIANKSSNICTIIRTDLLPDDEKEEVGNILAKNSYDVNDCDAIIEVLKTKGNNCKMVGLKYNVAQKTYYEAPRKLVKPQNERKKRRREDENKMDS